MDIHASEIYVCKRWLRFLHASLSRWPKKLNSGTIGHVGMIMNIAFPKQNITLIKACRLLEGPVLWIADIRGLTAKHYVSFNGPGSVQ